MKNKLLQIKIKERLNKLASFDYDNIECWQVVEAFNKAQLEWVRNQVHVNPNHKDSDESSKMQIDDIQNLLVTSPIGVKKRDKFFESDLLPSNYLYFKRVSMNGKNDCCPARMFTVYLDQASDVDNLLTDEFKSPSFEWGETFCTLQSNKVRIYTNNEFDVVNPTLTYYRKPRLIEIKDCVNPATGAIYANNITCEFKDDIAELIVDKTIAILAGDMESFNQMQIAQQREMSND
jgi:hypothetical protein